MTDSIVRRVDLNAPIDRVWRAISDHEEFGRWFRVALDQPFALGVPSTGHITYPGYEHVPWTAEIVAIDPPTRFAYRWRHMDETQTVREDWPSTLVEFRLERSGEGTRLTITEAGFDALPDGARESALRSNEGGWTEQVDNIRRHVDG